MGERTAQDYHIGCPIAVLAFGVYASEVITLKPKNSIRQAVP